MHASLRNTFATILPALQAEYPSQSPAPPETSWRHVDHLKLGSLTLPLLELLEADDRLRKRLYVVGPPSLDQSPGHGQSPGDWNIADLALFGVLHAYATPLLRDGSWATLPNLLRWYRRVSAELHAHGVLETRPDLPSVCDAASERLGGASFSLAGSYVKADDTPRHKV